MSDASEDDETAGSGAIRGAGLKTFAALGVVFGLAALSANFVAYRAVASVSPTSGSIWTRYYIDSAHAEFETIARQPGPIAIAVGASQMHYGFYPPAFDLERAEAGEPITSWNLASLAWTPFTVQLWTRRLVDALEAEGKRARFFLIGFTPHLMTRTTAGHRRWEAINLPAQARFAGWREVLLVARRSPEKASRLLAYRALGITPNLMREISETKLAGEPFRRALHEEWALPDGFPSWPSETRGGQRKFVEYASREEREKLMRRHLRARIRQSGLLSLHFDEGAIDDVVDTAQLAAGVADEVFVVVLPRNQEIVETRPEALARLDEALAEIEARSGARILNYYGGDDRFALEDFIDATHLAGDEPRQRFSRILARDVSRDAAPARR